MKGFSHQLVLIEESAPELTDVYLAYVPQLQKAKTKIKTLKVLTLI